MADSPQQMTKSSASASSSKTHKLSKEEMKSNGNIDRISSLPDSLLCDILSLLPTKNVVATSILSTRWKSLWTWVPTLDFEFDEPVGYMGFALFVYRVLVLRNKASCIKKFRLDFNRNIDSYHFFSWVCCAIARGVEELELTLSRKVCVELPGRLFTCKTLRVLKLSGGIVVDVPSSVHFPNLKILHLRFVEFVNDDSVRKLFSGCPVLEDLFVFGFGGDNVGVFNISSPALKNLSIFCLKPHYELNLFKLEINGPALEYLFIQDSVGEAFSIENLSFLVEAQVNFGVMELDGEYKGNCSFELLRGLYNVKSLSLSVDTIEIFKYVSNYDLPMFHNLTHLRITGDWYLLPNFLGSSHNLEVLSLKKYGFYHSGHACWRQPRHVPKCLSLHLTTIDISGFSGLEDELKFVSYILKNAKVLKTVNISCCHLDSKAKPSVLKKISMFSRGSETCQVAFH